MIYTEAGQGIDFKQNIGDFGWVLTVRYDGTELSLEVTDQEMKKIYLDIKNKLKGGE